MMQRKTPRLYVPLDARFLDDDRVIRAGERAAFLYVAILCAIKLDDADGTITLRKITRLHVDNWKPRLEKLLAEGLVMDITGPESEEVTYLVTGWGKWNLTSSERAHRAEIGRIAAQKRWNPDAKPNGLPIGVPNGSRMPIQDKSSKSRMTSLADLVETTLPEIARRAVEGNQ
jgi:hypothetical protein